MAWKVFRLVLVTIILWMTSQLPVQGSAEGDETNVLRLLVMVSVPGDGPTQSWERGLELLPAARVAVGDIAEMEDLLPGYHLNITEVATAVHSPNLALVEFIRQITHKRKNIVGVIGLFSNDITQLISTAAGHEGINLIQISGSTSPVFEDSGRYPHLYRMLPSSIAYVEATFALMRELEWSRIGVLCGTSHDSYYCKTAEALLYHENVEVLFYSEVKLVQMSKLTNLQRSGAKIIFAILPAHEASELLCAAYMNDLNWPEYAWIIPNINTKDFSPTTDHCDIHAMQKAMEGVFLLQNQLAPSDPNFKIISGESYTQYYSKYRRELESAANATGTVLHSNLYANVLHDSVWAFALALNSTITDLNLSDYRYGNRKIIESIERELSDISFPGALGHVKFDNSSREVNTVVDILHIKSGTSMRVGSYNPLHKNITLNRSSLGEIPDDELERIYQVFPLFIVVLFSCATVLFIVLTTIILTLFVCYRDQPEIKATSHHLSLFMFLGCYLLLLGTLYYIVSSGLVVHSEEGEMAVCSTFVSVTGVGIDLVLATLFAKMLRIYRIFTYFGQTGKTCSDCALVTLILFIVSGKVAEYMIWAVVDIHHLRDFETYHPEAKPPHYDVVQHCYSRHAAAWIATMFTYSSIIFLSLLFLAFKSRNIRRQNFKDTKKVNALIVTLIFIMCICASLWWLFRAIGRSNASKAMPVVGFILVAVVCQLCLFVPKTIPPIRRHLLSSYLRKSSKQVSHNTDSSSVCIKQNSSLTTV